MAPAKTKKPLFKNASICGVDPKFEMPPLAALEEALQAAKFSPCAPTQALSFGWVPPRAKGSDVLAELVDGQVLVKLCIERRSVPASAVKAAVDEKVKRFKEETGSSGVGSKLKKQFKEEAVFDLLPRAFSKRSTTMLWLDPQRKLVIVDAGNAKGLDYILTALVEAFSNVKGSKPQFALFNLQTKVAPATAMAEWLTSREPPSGFTVDCECELKSADDQGATVRYSRHSLDINEVPQHIAAGKVPTQLALTWNDRVSFMFTDAGRICKLQLLDAVMDAAPPPGEDDDQFDGDVAILTGELRELLPDLLNALGGELMHEQGAASAV